LAAKLFNETWEENIDKEEEIVCEETRRVIDSSTWSTKAISPPPHKNSSRPVLQRGSVCSTGFQVPGQWSLHYHFLIYYETFSDVVLGSYCEMPEVSITESFVAPVCNLWTATETMATNGNRVSSKRNASNITVGHQAE
jgi:hypothetical protein